MKPRSYAVPAGAIALVVIATTVWVLNQRRAPVPAAQTSPSVEVAAARYGDIPVTVNGVGRLGPSAGVQSRLAFVVAGRIA